MVLQVSPALPPGFTGSEFDGGGALTAVAFGGEFFNFGAPEDLA